MLVVASCQLSHRQGDASATEDGNGEAINVQPPLAPTKENIAKAAQPQASLLGDGARVKLVAGGKTLGELAAPECASEALDVRFRTQITSVFGTHAVEVHATDAAVAAKVEGYGMQFPKLGTAAALKAHVCAALKENAEAPEVTLPAELVDRTREWLELAAPDCERVEAGTDAWECKLPAAAPSEAKQELQGIQTTMIRRWSRQPYLLARRLAVGITLAQALEGDNVTAKLDVFCKIVATSLPIELPATLTTRRWQQAACASGAKARVDAAEFGLAKTVAEIDVMRQLFERTSRLGFLTIRIPAAQVPAKALLVSLQPQEDVADNLTRETARLWTTDASSDVSKEDPPKSCWHPVFAESPLLLKLARQLAMAGDAPKVTCDGDGTPQDQNLSTERYFAESITSETEFVVANGRSKTLRLPAGTYRYTLRPLPDDPEAWDDAAQVTTQATGQIVWDNKRPRPVISEWR